MTEEIQNGVALSKGPGRGGVCSTLCPYIYMRVVFAVIPYLLLSKSTPANKAWMEITFLVETTIRHELVHSVIEAIGAGRAPRWLAEGLALHIAGEGPKVARYLRQTEITVADLELRFSRPVSAEDMRADYALPIEVKRLIDAEGESAVWRRLIALRQV